MSRAPLISVVMAVRNGEAHLQEALDSIQGQSLREFEFIVVDDGSDDSTPEILAAHAAQDERMRVLRRDPANRVVGLNQACRMSRAPFIARLDADDVSRPSRLELQLRFMRAHPEVVASGTGVEIIDAGGRPLRRFRFPTSAAAIRRVLPSRNCLAHSAAIVRRDAFVRSGGYREPYGPAEDYDLWLRLDESGPLANIDDVLVQYRIHSGQLSLRRLEAQALCALAARISASRRRRGERELASGDGFSDSILLAAGVHEVVLRRSLIDHYLVWAETVALDGNASVEVERILDLAWQRSLSTGEQRRVRARRHWVRAKAALASRHRARSVRELLHSLALDPRLALGRLGHRGLNSLLGQQDGAMPGGPLCGS